MEKKQNKIIKDLYNQKTQRNNKYLKLYTVNSVFPIK